MSTTVTRQDAPLWTLYAKKPEPQVAVVRGRVLQVRVDLCDSEGDGC